MIDSKFLLFAALAFLTSTGLGDEDNLEQSWPSPDRQYLVRHTDTFDPQRTSRKRKTDLYDQPAAYILTREGKILWQMESPVDESAHSFRCVWATDSKSALILDRPARDDIEISLVMPKQPAKSGRLALVRIVDAVIKKGGIDDSKYLPKAWFGQWRFADGRFEGTVIVSQVHIYRLHLALIRSPMGAKLRLLDTTTFEKWDDHLEAL
ncbi:MAG TPA: hypothetical protein VK961_21550 [Chthoniobacter sp.]|nr:hypothetical protein [Chthoniobacter sp.]